MANAPDRYEKFVLPDGLKKIAFDRDTKVPNAGTFVIQREDHTIGNLVRMQLHRDKTVAFAGYKIPHPLEYRLLVKVQTNGKKTPIKVLGDVLQDLNAEVQDIRENFQEQVQKFVNRP